MAAKLTDDERARIVDAIRAGGGCVQIAKEVGRAPDTISRIAKTIGHTFGETNLARAHEARSAYCAERRAMIAATLTERAERLLADMEEAFVAFNFGGKENTYAEHAFDRPPVDAQFTMMRAAREAMRTVIDIKRADEVAEDAAGRSMIERLVDGLAKIGDAA